MKLARQFLFAIGLVLALCAPARADEKVSYGTVQSQGVAISYRLFGSGPPLVILNGGPGYPSTHFTELAQMFAAQFTVILFDQRGTGKSPLTTLDRETISMALMVEDLETLRKHLGYAQWNVLGHSFGGMYAMSYAVKYPQHVRAMVLSASGGSDLEFLGYIGSNITARLTMEQRAARAHWSSSEEARADPVRAALELKRLGAEANLYDRSKAIALADALTKSTYVPAINYLVWEDLERQHYDLKPALAQLKKPVLIVQGRQDFVGEATALKNQAAIPGAQLVFINECAHYPWIDQKETYLSTIKAFLAKSAAKMAG